MQLWGAGKSPSWSQARARKKVRSQITTALKGHNSEMKKRVCWFTLCNSAQFKRDACQLRALLTRSCKAFIFSSVLPVELDSRGTQKTTNFVFCFWLKVESGVVSVKSKTSLYKMYRTFMEKYLPDTSAHDFKVIIVSKSGQLCLCEMSKRNVQSRTKLFFISPLTFT